jgi:hypothetical protein
LDLDLRRKPLKYCIGAIALFGTETWTLRNIDQKYLKRVEMLCRRRVGKINPSRPIVSEMKYYKEARRKGTTCIP